MTGKLLKTQWKMFFNGMKSKGMKGQAGLIISIIVIGILAFFLSQLTWEIAGSIPIPIIEVVFPYIFLMSIGMILLIGVPQVFKNLYSEGDLSFLFTLPIPTRKIFWAKYIQSFIGIPLIVFAVTMIPAIIFGIRTGASLTYYPVVLIILFSNVVIGMSLAYLLNLGLIQVLPPKRANELMTVMSALTGLLIYFLFQVPNLFLRDSINQDMVGQLPSFPSWVPLSWGGDAITSVLVGGTGFILPTVFSALVALFLAVLASTLVERGFRTGWIRLSEGSGRKKKKKQNLKSSGSVRHPVVSVGIKEWRAIQRDLREWMVFMPIGFFIIFGVFGFISSGADLSTLLEYEQETWIIAQLIFLFIYANFNGPMAAAAVAREAKSMWLLQILPLTGRQIAIGKLWISWLLSWVILSIIQIVIGILLSWSVLYIVGGLVLTALASIGVSGIGLWMGTIGAKYNPANPQSRLTFAPSLILLILSYVYLFLSLVSLAFIVLPASLRDFFIGQDSIGGFIGFILNIGTFIVEMKTTSPALAIFIGVVGLVVVSIGTAIITIQLAAKRFDKGIDIEMVQSNSGRGLR